MGTLYPVSRAKGQIRVTGSSRHQGDGERVAAQHDQSDKPPDCGLAVDVGAHKLSPSGSAWPSALDLMRKRTADAAALKADRAAPRSCASVPAFAPHGSHQG